MPTYSNTSSNTYAYTTTATTSGDSLNPRYTFDRSEIPEIPGNNTYTVVGMDGWTREMARDYARQWVTQHYGSIRDTSPTRAVPAMEKHLFRSGKRVDEYYID